MKTDRKYRFSLQFPMRSEEEIRAGELLERLGNKKSRVVVAALNEYIQNHPGILENSISDKTIPSDISRAYLEQIILDLLKKNYSFEHHPEQGTSAQADSLKDQVNQDIMEMIEDLDIFLS